MRRGFNGCFFVFLFLEEVNKTSTVNEGKDEDLIKNAQPSTTTTDEDIKSEL